VEKLADSLLAERQLARVLSPEVIDELRAQTGYNPRQRRATALRLVLIVVQGFMLGQTLRFSSLRAMFHQRFGEIRPRAFQLRFKSPAAAAFFRAALGRAVQTMVTWTRVSLEGPLAVFDDVRIYDGTSQRVPPRGRADLPACTKGLAGSKWLVGYSLKTGLIEDAIVDAETASELPMWRRLVGGELRKNTLYLLDLAFFERDLFAQAQKAGAHLLMRLKSKTKVTILGHQTARGFAPLPNWSLKYYLHGVSQKRGTVFDMDVRWGRGKHAVILRLVGVSHGGRNGLRFYLTTIPRELLNAAQVVETYRLRWLIEFLFRELKQSADLGRCFTADRHAIEALTYGAMLGHVVVRSLRIMAALRHDVPLEELRPLACRDFIRPYAIAIVDALLDPASDAWSRLVAVLSDGIVAFTRERKTSKSRPRIARSLGAVGG
jgi:hypothetical protein